MGKKQLFLFVSVIFLSVTAFFPSAHAEEFAVENYTFTWQIAKVGGVSLDLQKEKAQMGFILRRSLGGPMQRLLVSSSEAKVIGELLSKATKHYDKHKQAPGRKSVDTLKSGDYQVTFSSFSGRDFGVELRRQKMFSAVVKMSKDEAVGMAEYMKDAEKMAAFIESRIDL